ncbi:MAG: dihydrodipicolinate synthase family protein, partial [Stenotrophomonas sp.]
IKEAVGDVGRVQALLALRSPGFAILSGDDGTAARSILSGVDGLISVGSNALPGAYRRMCDLAAAGDHTATEAWDARLEPFHDFCGVESNPIPVKALLHRIGIGHGLRLPLLSLSEAHHAAADHLATDIGALEALSSH